MSNTSALLSVARVAAFFTGTSASLRAALKRRC
jgi:hypothetical protein